LRSFSSNLKPRTWNLLPVLGLTLSIAGCSWFTDFKQQPKIDPWESPADSVPPRGNPQNSVPVSGTAAPGFVYDRSPLPPSIDAMAGIPNPIAPDARSLNNGRINFQINCAVCHGPLGHGDGPATRFGMAMIGLTSEITKNRTDGYIFGMIRNGRGLMPPYNRIEEPDRWDVVNYVRSLQGKLGTAPDTAHGRPGETGALVPGVSVSAPTRPAPYYHHVYPQAGTSAVPPASPSGAAPSRAERDSLGDTTRARAPADTSNRRRRP